MKPKLQDRKQDAVRLAASALKELGLPDDDIQTSLKDIGEKCGYAGGYPVQVEEWHPVGGATSFDDYDKWQVGQQIRTEFDQLEWEFRSIMTNILDSAQMLGPTDRASAITAAAAEFAKRAEAIPGDVADDNDIDLEDLEEDEDEMVEGESDRGGQPGPIGNIVKFLRGIKAAGGDVEYAGKNKSFPISTAKSVKSAASLIGNAGADNFDEATLKRNITRIAKKKGLTAALPKSWGVKESDPPEPEPEAGAFTSYKDLDGNWRWFALYSNRYEDRESETFSEAGQKAYVAWADQDPDHRYPELWDWHTPVGLGQKDAQHLGMGRADILDYQEGLAIAGGYWYPGFEHIAEAYSGRKDLGVSHGYDYAPWALKDDGTYTSWYTFEISPLPRGRAANDYTVFLATAGSKEIDMFTIRQDRREHLLKTHGKDFVESLEGNLGGIADRLKQAGISFKDIGELTAEAIPAVTTPTAAAPAASGSVPPAATAAVGSTPATPDVQVQWIESVKEALIPGLGAAIGQALQPVLTRLDALEAGTKDLSLNNAPRVVVGAGFSPSSDPSTVEDGRSAMARAAAQGAKDDGAGHTQAGSPDDGGMGWYLSNGLFGDPKAFEAAQVAAGNIDPSNASDIVTRLIASAGIQ